MTRDRAAGEAAGGIYPLDLQRPLQRSEEMAVHRVEGEGHREVLVLVGQGAPQAGTHLAQGEGEGAALVGPEPVGDAGKDLSLCP